MTTKIDGTLGITFPDASVQSTAGIPTNSTQISKAWVNFDGTTSVRRSSYNVGSVTRVSTGNYSINFTTPLSNTNYSTVASQNIGQTICNYSYSPALNQVNVATGNIVFSAFVDPTIVCVAVFSL